MGSNDADSRPTVAVVDSIGSVVAGIGSAVAAAIVVVALNCSGSNENVHAVGVGDDYDDD